MAAAIAGASACAAPADSQGSSVAAIVGGAPAEAGAWPNVGILDSGCSALLQHPKLIVYAAHCAARPERVWFGERFDVSVDSASRTVRVAPSGKAYSVATERCEAHPEGMIGNGLDVAFCTLERRLQIPVVGPMLGCTRDSIEPDLGTTLVGFGFDAEQGGKAGIKRVVGAPLISAGQEIEIGTRHAGTCRGDSGGPALVELAGSDGQRAWHVLGVLSSGPRGRCGKGYYTDIANVIGWLEQESQLELSPCYDSLGNWKPLPTCTTGLDPRGHPTRAPRQSAACGDPSPGSAGDRHPPSVSILSVEGDSLSSPSVVEVEAEDRESGVQRVEVEWLNAQGETLGRLEDELAPYRFKLESDSEVDRIEATALDFAGNTTQIEWPPAPATNGCSVGPGPAAKGASQMRFGLLCALLVLLVARRRRRIAHAQLGDGPR
ncbi:MAG: S1 family peptidase [Proteobacteria bacterium]|nr:S1 family peptidase [Pseudomonadota bacterium]